VERTGAVPGHPVRRTDEKFRFPINLYAFPGSPGAMDTARRSSPRYPGRLPALPAGLPINRDRVPVEEGTMPENFTPRPRQTVPAPGLSGPASPGERLTVFGCLTCRFGADRLLPFRDRTSILFPYREYKDTYADVVLNGEIILLIRPYLGAQVVKMRPPAIWHY
jgi:hypothetical protein